METKEVIIPPVCNPNPSQLGRICLENTIQVGDAVVLKQGSRRWGWVRQTQTGMAPDGSFSTTLIDLNTSGKDILEEISRLAIQRNQD